ncbi:hypothetical protein FNYG_10897 [Fusarium nygamai]|uniref:Uncharacterized protein n=1 Tax=Gibberella nygamai TaxID=42673 RepID=A0A2K0W0K4_GIBNY|nr:hypothetical protein FNYG_10897 [Fusarium nygamai]
MDSWCFPHFDTEPVKQTDDVHRPSVRVIPIFFDHNDGGSLPTGLRDIGQRRRALHRRCSDLGAAYIREKGKKHDYHMALTFIGAS